MPKSPNNEFRLLANIPGSVKSVKQRRIIFHAATTEIKNEWVKAIVHYLWIACGSQGPDPSESVGHGIEEGDDEGDRDVGDNNNDLDLDPEDEVQNKKKSVPSRKVKGKNKVDDEDQLKRQHEALKQLGLTEEGVDFDGNDFSDGDSDEDSSAKGIDSLTISENSGNKKATNTTATNSSSAPKAKAKAAPADPNSSSTNTTTSPSSATGSPATATITGTSPTVPQFVNPPILPGYPYYPYGQPNYALYNPYGFVPGAVPGAIPVSGVGYPAPVYPYGFVPAGVPTGSVPMGGVMLPPGVAYSLPPQYKAGVSPNPQNPPTNAYVASELQGLTFGNESLTSSGQKPINNGGNSNGV